MNIWILNQIVDGEATSEIVFSQEEAEARAEAHYRPLWTEHMGETPYRGASAAHSVLTGEGVRDDELMWISEHKLGDHPAVKEAIATLYSSHERLEMNNYDGEEDPFIGDCETAITMLEGREPPE